MCFIMTFWWVYIMCFVYFLPHYHLLFSSFLSLIPLFLRNNLTSLLWSIYNIWVFIVYQFTLDSPCERKYIIFIFLIWIDSFNMMISNFIIHFNENSKLILLYTWIKVVCVCAHVCVCTIVITFSLLLNLLTDIWADSTNWVLNSCE